jgi:hypothetical protein
VLLHDPALTALIDGFFSDLDGEAFEQLLPALRRAFSGLDAYQRKRLLDQARAPTAVAPGEAGIRAEEPADAAFATALPLLKTILGLEP